MLVFRFLTVMPAFMVIGLWFLFQIINSLGVLGDSSGGVAYGAHIGGFIAGAVLINAFGIGLDRPQYRRSKTSRISVDFAPKVSPLPACDVKSGRINPRLTSLAGEYLTLGQFILTWCPARRWPEIAGQQTCGSALTDVQSE